MKKFKNRMRFCEQCGRVRRHTMLVYGTPFMAYRCGKCGKMTFLYIGDQVP